MKNVSSDDHIVHFDLLQVEPKPSAGLSGGLQTFE